MPNFEKQTGRDRYFKELEKEEKAIIDPRTGKVYNHLVEKIDCSLCGSKKYTILFNKLGFSFARCQNCTLIFTNPRVIENKLVKIYKSESFANRYWKEVLLSPAQVKFNNKNYGTILDVIIKHRKGGKLLDIGCSYGHFLKLARQRGFKVEGIELENDAVEYAKQEFNLPIHQKVLSKCNFKKNEFDVATILGVLEHVPNPLAFLKNINKILKTKGLLGITLPNIESLLAMVLKDKTRTFTGRNHLTYFSARTLTQMLKRAGFKVIYQQTYAACLDDILNQMQSLDPFDDKQLKYLPEDFIKLLKNKKKKNQLEKIIYNLGLGSKLRVIAQKEK